MEQMPLLLVDLKCIFLLHIIQSEEAERKDSLQAKNCNIGQLTYKRHVI